MIFRHRGHLSATFDSGFLGPIKVGAEEQMCQQALNISALILELRLPLIFDPII